MQMLTSTQKLLRQRSFLSSFIPLLALFLGLGASQKVMADPYTATFYRNTVSVSGTNSTGAFGPTTYYGKGSNTTTRPSFQGQNFGTITLASGALRIANPTLTVIGRGATETLANTGFLFYRVYPATTTPKPNFSSVALTKSGTGTGTSVADAAVYTNNTTIDLLSGLTSGGSYTIEIGFQLDESNSDPGESPTFTLSDFNGFNGYAATFTIPSPVVTPAGGTTTWIGGNNLTQIAQPGGPNDWNNPANWTNGVPTALSDAIIPVPARPQPPILNVNNQDYSVRNLTVQGSGVTSRGLVRVTTATLKIYGDIVNGGNGILATTDAPGTTTDPGSASSFIVFAGGNQTIDQGRFANLRIENNAVTADASGNPVITPSTVAVVKSIFGKLDIPSTLTFAPNINANLRTTSFDANVNPQIDQNGGAVVDLITSGSVFGETTTASVLGLFKSSRTIVIGQKNTFGGIGIDITIFGTSDGSVSQQGFITRSTGLAFSPVTSGTGPRPQSVKRVFGNSFTGVQAGFNADVVFHYLNSTSTLNGRYNELNGNVEGRLELFRTTSGSTFTRLGGVNTVDPGGPDSYPGNAGTVEKAGLNSINTLTLADFSTNPLPLPVVLSAFDVKQVNTEAVVTWSTASEKNSLGFYVEVSTDGKDFRSLGFVASLNGNSTRPQSYRFVDTEKGKVGQRYYRLHQVDNDGKIAFSPVRAVDFGVGSPISNANLQGYPNPFTSDLTITTTGASTGKGLLRLMDLTGRTIQSKEVLLEGAATTLLFDNLSELKSGMYIVQLTLPSGKQQQFKVQKQ